MRIVSVNVGRARLLQLGGAPKKTGIFKEPVEGRVMLRDDAVEGDLVADTRVHGGYDKAVYAYASEDYAWWSAELDRDLGPGWFGENLTTAGIDLAEARIGERWRAGEALFEVSEPRQPCSTLGAKMGDQRFVKQFAKALRLGTYLRIIEPGEVAAGDPIEVVERPDHDVTIGLLGRVLFEDSSLGPQILAADELTDCLARARRAARREVRLTRTLDPRSRLRLRSPSRAVRRPPLRGRSRSGPGSDRPGAAAAGGTR